VDARVDAEVTALREAGVHVKLGPVGPEVFAGVEGLAISPGVDPRQPAVQSVLAVGKPVFGELELAVPLPAKCIAITGTNGKSTTTALTGALVHGCGVRAFVGGNLGDPIAGWLRRTEAVDVAVLELSSFQIDVVNRFAPEVAVVLNVTPDHLDRYDTLGVYTEAKERLVRQVSPTGTAVLNYDDPAVRAMAQNCRGRVLWFSTQNQTLPGDGVTLDGDMLTSHGAVQGFGSVDLEHSRLLGRHNRENALAAFLAVYALGLAKQAKVLLPAYRGFLGLEHRLELAGTVRGVRYINDSKATNDASAATALYAMQAPVVLLVGGKDKGGGYTELFKAAQSRNVRGLIAFGAAGAVIVDAFAQAKFPVHRVDRMRDACEYARTLAQDGDVVLLAPGCSSFDEFKDYKHRGRVFKEWVHALGAGKL
jgi:UDP-N-acetylmuramoylalanine--D-glutamate ligase